MKGAVLRRGSVRAGLVAGGFALCAAFIGDAPLPAPVRAAGMLALPCALALVLGREDRRLGRARDDIRAGTVRPALGHLLLRERRKLDQALHR